MPEVVAAIVGALALLVTTWLQIRRSHGGTSGQLKADAELLQLLPEDSVARLVLLSHLDSRILAMIIDRETKQRDASGIGIAVSLIIMAGALVVLAASNGGWWWASLAISVPLALVSLAGLVQSARRLERDAKGNPIEPKSDDEQAE